MSYRLTAHDRLAIFCRFFAPTDAGALPLSVYLQPTVCLRTTHLLFIYNPLAVTNNPLSVYL
jgi:hypothetical protein